MSILEEIDKKFSYTGVLNSPPNTITLTRGEWFQIKELVNKQDKKFKLVIKLLAAEINDHLLGD